MNGDSGDVDYLGNPLLYSTLSNLYYLPRLIRHVHTFVSSEGCHIVAGTTYRAASCSVRMLCEEDPEYFGISYRSRLEM